MKQIGSTDNIDEEFEAICEEAIALIPSYGVADATLVEACRRLGKENSLGKFDGIRSVLEYVYDKLIHYITTAYKDKDPQEIPRIRDKILCLLEACIKFHASLPESQRFIKAVVYYSLLPSNTYFSTSMVSKVSDAMWRLANDESTDFSYYTKRVTLSATYVLSIMHMSNDTSEEFRDTLAFTKRRIDNIISFHKFKSKIKNLLPKCRGLWDVRFDR